MPWLDLPKNKVNERSFKSHGFLIIQDSWQNPQAAPVSMMLVQYLRTLKIFKLGALAFSTGASPISETSDFALACENWWSVAWSEFSAKLPFRSAEWLLSIGSWRCFSYIDHWVLVQCSIFRLESLVHKSRSVPDHTGLMWRPFSVLKVKKACQFDPAFSKKKTWISQTTHNPRLLPFHNFLVRTNAILSTTKVYHKRKSSFLLFFNVAKSYPWKTSCGIPNDAGNERTWKHTDSWRFKNHGVFCWAFSIRVDWIWFCRCTPSGNGTHQHFSMAASCEPEDLWDKRVCFARLSL